MIKHLLIAAAALLMPCGAAAQILPSGAQQIQGTEAPNRGYPVSSIIVDASGNSLTSAQGLNVVEVPSNSAAAGVTTTRTTAVSAGLVVKASAGNLYGFNIVSGAAAGYVLVLNQTTVPADGAAVTPFRCLPLAANTGLDVNLRGQPTRFTSGIVVLFSTTGCYLYTASATAFIAGDAQ